LRRTQSDFPASQGKKTGGQRYLALALPSSLLAANHHHELKKEQGEQHGAADSVAGRRAAKFCVDCATSNAGA
jgi:hypothetical protein